MNELSEGGERALNKLENRLKSARRDYLLALFDLIPIAGKAALEGDTDALQRLQEVERAYDVLVTENLAAHATLGV